MVRVHEETRRAGDGERGGACLKSYFFLYSSKHQHIESQTDKGERHSARHSPFMPDRRSLLPTAHIDMSKNTAVLTATAHKVSVRVNESLGNLHRSGSHLTFSINR